MSTRIQLARLLAAAVVLPALAAPAAARFPGFPPIPSTCAQWWGYGYGPGHHAPMLMTPGAEPQRGPRYIRTRGECVLASPAPYAPIGCYGDGGNCGSGGGDAGAGAYPYTQPAMAPPAGALRRDESLTWR